MGRTVARAIWCALLSGVLLGFAVVASTPAAAAVSLEYGVRGSHVRTLQEWLDCSTAGDFFGYYTYTDYFGEVTRDGLVRWQRSVGSPADGQLTVGNNEWARLQREATSDRCVTGIDPRSVRYSRSEHYAVDISKRQRALRILRDGVVTLRADARFGDARGSSYITREGGFRIFRKEGADYVSTEYDVPMPYASFFSGGQATHYSANFARVGYDDASHGCVNLRVMSAARAVNALPLRTVVVVH
jgi:hypothetical protein